ncbi:uncharacterized protein LOC115044819 [Echeneis naucrates]|uniref:uncharacterized protein LOC115044819 n=1 Tax=Echeneis naucrates TaxID=173247 RepID=UPI001113EA12|nr:uncharacterized protein LOC115044819 [Echeneis naucrates]
MGLVQYFVAVLMLPAQLVFTTPLSSYSTKDQSMCPPGKFLESGECKPCPAGSFTTKKNYEESCHDCFRDCRQDHHLKVVQNCTSTSDLKCVCEDGYQCAERVRYSENCALCVKTVVETQSAVTSRHDEQTSVTSEHSSTSPEPCQVPECLKSAPPTPSADVSSSRLAAIFGSLAFTGCLALMGLFCFCCPGDETYFKRAIAKLCHKARQDASHMPSESSLQFPRDTFSPKQQPPSISAANLGPVHVHSAGTVIFSLLNQFTGQVGETIKGGHTAEMVGSEGEDDDRDCPAHQATPSPSIHLSEEKSGETDSMFFPSQEQGKDCHISKEEEL